MLKMIYIYIYIYIYKRYDKITFNNTDNTSKSVNQYTTDVVNNYKINKVSNLKKAYCNLTDDIVINKHNTIYTNDNITVTKIHKRANFNDNNTLQGHRTYK